MPYSDELTLYISAGAEVDPAQIGVDELRLVRLADSAAPPRDGGPYVWLAVAGTLGDSAAAISARLCELATGDATAALVLSAEVAETTLTPAADALVHAYLNPHAPAHLQAKIVRNALQVVRMQHAQRRLNADLQRFDSQLRQLHQIGIALSAERDVDTLLELILRKAREITGADAGSLYLVEDDGGRGCLRFKLSQNDSVPIDYHEFTLPLDDTSLAGYTGSTGRTLRLADVYELDPAAPYSFSRGWDEETGYRTRSMLVVPMRTNKGEMRGVLQLINRKRTPARRLATVDDCLAEVLEFPPESEALVESLASQAAVAVENNLLLDSISRIFEGFLMGWVKAVEDRDPATAGHSQRVTAMTLALAREVNRLDSGPYAGVRFSEQQLEELRYAGLLHDIGKIYVRAEVFLKAKKLYAHHLAMIQERFDFVKRTLEADYGRRKLETVLGGRDDPEAAFRRLDDEAARELELLDDYFQTILIANEPTVLDEDRFERLAEIAGRTYRDVYGNTQHLLHSEELKLLNIRRGNLDDAERLEIESHVVWSKRILERIPWSPALRRIPEIAGAHHEKLDGSGYPDGLAGDVICLESRMMTIADIYDALTAADRPYKKAQPVDRALRILHFEEQDGHLDSELLRLFEQREVFRVAHLEPIEEVVRRLVSEDVL